MEDWKELHAKMFVQTLEAGVAALSPAQQAAIYRPCAEACAKYAVLPEMRRQFEECGRDLDAQYAKYGETPYFFAKVVEPHHVYEMGYPRCVCPEAEMGLSAGESHCECSRQSILYVLRELLPGKNIQAETLETVLSGGEKCRFRVTVD